MLKWDLKQVLSYFPIILIFTAIFLLKNHHVFSTYIVTKQDSPLTLTFPGVVKPLKMVKVASPIDGNIDSINVKMGTPVTKNQVLFYLVSSSLQATLRTTINNYLRSKSALEAADFQYKGNEALYKAGLISKNEFLSSKDAFETAELTLWDATEQLKTLFSGVGLNAKEFEKLTLSDIDKIKALIASAQRIKIVSPVDGILSTQNNLSSPGGGSGGGSSGSEELSVGTAIKTGDIIAIIYEMNGLYFTVNIVETQLSEIKIGQKATITGPAFPSLNLQGYVNSVNQEANTSGGAIPTYTIRIIVPKITAKDRLSIKEGMSATITLIKERPPMIRIPLTALIRKDDNYLVKKINPYDGQIEEVPVETGDTDESTVEIKSGLVEGDVIVIPD